MARKSKRWGILCWHRGNEARNPSSNKNAYGAKQDAVLALLFYVTINYRNFCLRDASTSSIHNLAAEGREGYIGQFEMLLAKGDADDGDA